MKEKIDLITLSDLTTLMDVAIDNKYITKEEQETVLDWLEYPEFWKSKKDITIEKEFGTSGS